MKYNFYLLAAVGLVGIASGEEAQVLKFDLEVGKEYDFSQVMEMNMEMKNPMTQEAMNVSSTTTLEYSTDIEADPKGEKVTVTIDRLAMKTTTAGMNMEYDSADEATQSGPIAGMMEGVVGMKSGVIFDEEGNVIESFQAEEVSAATAQLGVTSDQFVEAIGQSLKMFPDHALKVGDTWEVESEMSLGGIAGDPISVKTAYKLEGYENLDGNDSAKISFKSEMDGAVDMGGMSMTLKSEKFEGTMIHDTKLNVVRKADSDIEMTMSVPEDASTGAAGLGTIPYKMKISQELKSVK